MNNRIKINPNICHGNPVIRNTRILVSNILADLAAEIPVAEILDNYPELTNEGIRAALDFSSEITQLETIPYNNKAI